MSNDPKVYKLQREIIQYRHGTQRVMMYFNNLTSLWSELDLLLPPISCVCDVEETYTTREEQQRLIQFLVGLNDVFDHTRQQILLMNPLPKAALIKATELQCK